MVLMDAIAAHPPAPYKPTLDQIKAVEAALLRLPQREIETVQWLSGGMLYRRITIPADTYATGAVHKCDHISIMVSGEMLVHTDRGMERVSGFNEWPGKAGHKRIGYAIADTVWLTAHRTDATTIKEAEADLFEEASMLLNRREHVELEAA